MAYSDNLSSARGHPHENQNISCGVEFGLGCHWIDIKIYPSGSTKRAPDPLGVAPRYACAHGAATSAHGWSPDGSIQYIDLGGATKRFHGRLSWLFFLLDDVTRTCSLVLASSLTTLHSLPSSCCPLCDGGWTSSTWMSGERSGEWRVDEWWENERRRDKWWEVERWKDKWRVDKWW
mmetsp:Transcript_15993/g.31860  ORF Transcript_15993/g.31860 Transcript_15993/m.31860 type:complete len:177 (+) Transcript_15993:311-841(+)